MKKKTIFIIISVVVLLGVSVLLLGDKVFKTDINDLMSEKRHIIQNQEKIEITLNIPKSELPESIYTSEGQSFSENEIVVYQTETTSIYLEKVMLANGNKYLDFIFNCSYDLQNSGTILTPYRKNVDAVYSDVITLVSKELTDDTTTYQDAVWITGSGPSEIFTVTIPMDVCKKAIGTMKINVFINQLTYDRM